MGIAESFETWKEKTSGAKLAPFLVPKDVASTKAVKMIPIYLNSLLIFANGCIGTGEDEIKVIS